MRQFLILKFLPIFLFLRWTAAWIGPRVHHSTRPRFSAVLFGPVSGNRLRVAPSSSCGKPKLIDDDPFELVQANSHLGRKRFLSNAPSPKNMTIGMTIVGGQDVMPGDVCWQAKLAKDGFFHCGASIIGKRTVMTASHCVYDYSIFLYWQQDAGRAVFHMAPFARDGQLMNCQSFYWSSRILVTARGRPGALGKPSEGLEWKDQSATPDHFKVTIGAPLSNTNSPRGTLDPSGCAQDFSVVQVITNSRFNKKINENDIAILVLGEAIDFSRRCACPVCLKSRLPKVGEICAVSGFGLEREGGAGGRNPRPLKFVHLNVLETKYGNQCAIDKGYGTPPNLNNFLCAGNVIGEDTCQGDSGGPVVCFDQRTRSHYQAGIVSYGRGCGRGVGGIYTRVSSYLNWIRANSGGDQLHLDLRN